MSNRDRQKAYRDRHGGDPKVRLRLPVKRALDQYCTNHNCKPSDALEHWLKREGYL